MALSKLNPLPLDQRAMPMTVRDEDWAGHARGCRCKVCQDPRYASIRQDVKAQYSRAELRSFAFRPPRH